MNDADTSVKALKDLVQDFIAERDWQQFHDPKNLSMSIAIEAAELMEHFQWLRTDQLTHTTDDAKVRAVMAEEMADIFCYLLSLCSTAGIDLASALEAKMTKNRKKYPASEYKGRF